MPLITISFLLIGGKDKSGAGSQGSGAGNFIQQLIIHHRPQNSRLPTPDYICDMEVNDALVTKLARLSKLQFSDVEKAEIRNDLQQMIGFVEKLNELNLEGVPPLLHMSEEINVLREDEVKGSVSREEALKNAPTSNEEFFMVPKVIKK